MSFKFEEIDCSDMPHPCVVGVIKDGAPFRLLFASCADANRFTDFVQACTDECTGWSANLAGAYRLDPDEPSKYLMPNSMEPWVVSSLDDACLARMASALMMARGGQGEPTLQIEEGESGLAFAANDLPDKRVLN